MEKNLTGEKGTKNLANNFDSIKTPSTMYNTKDRLEYYKDRKGKDSDLPKDILNKVRVNYVGKFLEFYKVYEVSGNLLRTKVDIDFVSGGNPGRYAYVPEGEIWIDENLHPNDLAATVIHEFVECIIMEHKGKSYNHSHDKASALELQFRKKHLKEENQSIKTELKRASEFIANFIKNKKTPKN